MAHQPVIDWRRKISDHVAYALLVYTCLQILMTISLLETHGGSLLPYLALVILVVAIIPSCRWFQTRWDRLTDDQAHDMQLEHYYKRDRRIVWLMAIGLPFALSGMFKALAIAFL